jgi:hypothetical protein
MLGHTRMRVRELRRDQLREYQRGRIGGAQPTGITRGERDRGREIPVFEMPQQPRMIVRRGRDADALGASASP